MYATGIRVENDIEYYIYVICVLCKPLLNAFVFPKPEFWEEHFQCRYPRSVSTPYNSDFSVECDVKSHLAEKKPKFENQLQFVSDSVLAFAYALYDMHADYCGKNFVGLCDKMKPVKGPELLKYLRRVNFTGKSRSD